MNVSKELLERAGNTCELCSANEDLNAHIVFPKSDENMAHQIVGCPTCISQINNKSDIDPNHWRCLNESIWSEVDAVKVESYRMLNKLQEPWAQDLLGMIYLDEATQEWAEAGLESNIILHRDSNGNILSNGDTVTLIQDLNVKGASFTAKRGLAVRRIRLVHDNAEHIEGKVDGQQIVILTKYVKKSS